MSSKWVEDGPEIIEAGTPQVIESAGVQAEGWKVYQVIDREKTEAQNEKIVLEFEAAQAELGDKADRKAKPKMGPPVRNAYTRVVGKKKYVLMMRPKALQLAVNKIYADMSRVMVNQEVKGETASANEAHDPGVITNEDLRRMRRYEDPDPGEEYLAPSAGSQPTRLQEAQEIPVG